MDPDIKLFAQALLNGTHSIKAIGAEFCEDHQAVDLSSLSLTDLRAHDCDKLIPPEPIQRYLDSGDVLSDHTIDQMELAMEKTAGISHPAYITSFREGTEKKGNLSVKYFYLAFKV